MSTTEVNERQAQTTAKPDTISVKGRTFTIERVEMGKGDTLYGCGILPLRRSRDDLIRDIERAQGPEWRRGDR